MKTLSRSSHSYLRNHPPYLSPRFPQMWIKGVNKHVDKIDINVRFVTSVRLSPPVDYLWTEIVLIQSQSDSNCGQSAPAWGSRRNYFSSSPANADTNPASHTDHPQPHLSIPGGKSSVVHTIHTTYDDDYLSPLTNSPHRLRTTPRGYLPYPSSGAETSDRARHLNKGVMS